MIVDQQALMATDEEAAEDLVPLEVVEAAMVEATVTDDQLEEVVRTIDRALVHEQICSLLARL